MFEFNIMMKNKVINNREAHIGNQVQGNVHAKQAFQRPKASTHQ